jgi:tRNA/tmRNA/rRNA uracil-C5-methylase (TrmA/RlmC/RlmD family)
VFGSCGGCSWQHLDLATQTDAKAQIVRDAFGRIAKLPLPRDFRIHGSPAPYGYRSRTRLLATGGRVGYRRRRSNALCAIQRCPVLVPELDAALEALPGRAGRRTGEWELAVGDEGEAVTVSLPPQGDGEVTLRPGTAPLRVTGGVFFQAHRGLRGPFRDVVTALAGDGDSLLELYAGSGFFTGELARRYDRVLAVEGVALAAADLRHNTRASPGVAVLHASVEAALDSDAVADLEPETVVLDPPREGLSDRIRERLLDLAPRRVVFASCDPATLARDVGHFVDCGYDLDHVEAFDLFPQTPHVECVAALRRAQSSPSG